MQAGTKRQRTIANEEETIARLQDRTFYLEWFDEEGTPCHGSGFFITPTTALTAYHNLPPEVLAIEGAEASEQPIRAKLGGRDITLYWAVPGENDRQWQERYQIAVLEARPPLDLPEEKSFFVPDTLPARRRSEYWRGRELLVTGFPKSEDYAPQTIPCKVTWQNPIRDTMRLINGKRVPYVPAALALVVDTDDALSGLRGMSGGPVYDTELCGVIGLLVGVDKKAFTTELVHLVKHWAPARLWVQELKPEPPSHVITGRRWWWLGLLLALMAAASFWLWHSPVPQRLAIEVVRLADGRRSKLPDTKFTEGEHVRFAITTPVSGHLYVIDRELAKGGQERPSYLIFPTRRTGLGRNRVAGGTTILFPGEDDNPPYVTPHPRDGDFDYAGELLTVLIFRDPLPLELENGPLPVKPGQIPTGDLIPRIFDQPPGPEPLAMERVRVAVRRAAP